MRLIPVLFAVAGLIFPSLGSAFGQDDEMSYGKAEFLGSCAPCHGADGRGGGPLGDVLMNQPADLTRIEQRNGGHFPYYEIFAVIDGRYVVPGHGDREMPVWGRQFLELDTEEFGPIGGEAVAQERIHQLIEYIMTMQR